MGTRKRPVVLEGRRGIWLMIILLLATYIAVFSSGIGQFSPLEIGVLIVVGVLYSLISIFDESFRDRLGMTWGTVAYFGIQLILAAVFIYVSRVQGWLIMMPLVSQSVIWLPRRWMVVACVLIFAVILTITIVDAPRLMGMYHQMVERIPEGAPWLIMFQAGAQYLVVIVFVVLLVEMAMREERARDELSDAHRKLREYSTGMKRKLGLIQAFQTRPPLLILDEPTEGLDPLMQESFYQLLSNIIGIYMTTWANKIT